MRRLARFVQEIVAWRTYRHLMFQILVSSTVSSPRFWDVTTGWTWLCGSFHHQNIVYQVLTSRQKELEIGHANGNFISTVCAYYKAILTLWTTQCISCAIGKQSRKIINSSTMLALLKCLQTFPIERTLLIKSLGWHKLRRCTQITLKNTGLWFFDLIKKSCCYENFAGHIFLDRCPPFLSVCWFICKWTFLYAATATLFLHSSWQGRV